tara:strand:- start:439 stop:678 length:240 start_codon:yes stop_codon:yes gene_type:complete
VVFLTPPVNNGFIVNIGYFSSFGSFGHFGSFKQYPAKDSKKTKRTNITTPPYNESIGSLLADLIKSGSGAHYFTSYHFY